MTNSVSQTLVTNIATNTATIVIVEEMNCGKLWCHHLPERIGIVGVQAHNIARCILVKIANRQFLHMGKHIIPNLFQNTLRNWHHQPDV